MTDFLNDARRTNKSDVDASFGDYLKNIDDRCGLNNIVKSRRDLEEMLEHCDSESDIHRMKFWFSYFI